MMKKRLFSLLLALALCLTLLPTAAFAEEAATLPGSGTSESPYLISTAEELALLGTLDADGTYYVKLTNDIVLNNGTFDASGSFTKAGETATSTPNSWTPLPKAEWHIDGNNKSISGLYINSSNQAHAGLFSYLDNGSSVQDLTIKNSYVGLTHSDGLEGYVGIFAGQSEHTRYMNCVGETNILSTSCYATGGIVGWSSYDTFIDVHTSGSITGQINFLGGLAGRVGSDSVFKNCWNKADIVHHAATESNIKGNVGGITGEADGSAHFLNCVNLGSLSGGSRVGGIVGQVDGNKVKLQNCYSLKNITGSEEYTHFGNGNYGLSLKVGTLSGMGSPTVSSCYAEDGSTLYDIGYPAETNVTHFSGYGKLTESGDADELLNALNQNLYEMVSYGDGDGALKKWSRTADGYPLPNEVFHDTTTYYGIWLGGVRISERNKYDIFKDGLASYDADENILYLHDGLTVTGLYNDRVLYAKKTDLKICVDGNVTLESPSNASYGYVIHVGIIDDIDYPKCPLTISAAEGKSATMSVISTSNEYGFNIESLTLDGDICLLVRTKLSCFNACKTFTITSPSAILDAKNTGGGHSIRYGTFRDNTSVSLPSETSQKLYEGTSDPLTQVNSFTTRKNDSLFTYSHIRIAPLVYALDAALPDSLTVSMETANAQDTLQTWATGQIQAIEGITAANSTITVSNVTAATAGSEDEPNGTDGSFQVTVTVTESGISKTRTIPGIIKATPALAVEIKAGTLDATGLFTESTDATFTSGDSIVFAVTYRKLGTPIKTLSGTVSCFEEDSKELTWNESNNCYLTPAFTWPKAQTAAYTASYSIGGGSDSAYTQQTGTMSVSVQGITLNASDFTFAAPTDLTYDGAAKAASVTFNGDRDHPCGTVSVKYYDQNGAPVTEAKAVGTYTVKIDVPKNDYYQAATDLTASGWTFTVGAKALNSNDVTVDAIADHTYNGSKQEPKVTVKHGQTTLTRDRDYAVSYANNENAGTATVTITGKGNYSGVRTTTFAIQPKVIGLSSVNISDKEYTGTDEATGTAYFRNYVVDHAPEPGTDYTISATFNDKNVGDFKTVTGTVTLLNRNYCFADNATTQSFQPTRASITPKPVTATVTVTDKVYDGNANATVTAAVTDGLFAGDSLTISGLTGTFDNANAGESKTVTVNTGGSSITGTDAGNYKVTIPTSATGSITKRTVTITVADKSAYRDSEAPDLSSPVLGEDYTVDGLLGDDALLTPPTLRYDPEPDMGAESDTTAIRASGADAGDNYTIEYVDGTLTITRRPVPASNGKHHITVDDAENGSVTVEPSGAKAGETVTVTVKPDAGYAVEDITITDRNGNKVKVTRKGDKYTFEMPETGVTVKVEFARSGNPFVDVPADKYFYDAVLWAVENGITGGVDATHFAPYASCTRGQLVTFLWRAAGEPAAKNARGFADVAAGRYCEAAVAWAAENGIVGGYDDGTFRPDATVTRQQTAAILWRFAKYAGMDVTVGEDTNILSFSDALTISDYAVPAIQWAVGAAVMGGSNGSLLPGNVCNRAQIVTMLYRSIAK